jgi:hypothetical protein
MKGNLRERLYQLETPPPGAVWERIAQTLDDADEHRAPVVPLQPVRKNNWMKIALAASVVGFVAMTVLWYTEKGKKVEQAIVRENTTIPPDSLKQPGTQNTTAQVTETPADSNTNNSNNNSNNNTATHNGNGNNQLPGNDNNIQNTATNNNAQQKRNPSLPVTNGKNIVTQKDPSPLVADNNNNLPKVVARDSSGKVIQDINEIQSVNPTTATGPVTAGDKSIARILSKISANGDDEELDKVIKDSPYWKNKIQEWRNKLIRSGYTPNAVNLMDLPSLLKILQDEKTP